MINLSLEFPAEVRSAEIPDMLSALRYAHRRGVVVVAAAGNQADITVAYPARAQSVIAVGATTPTGCQADYSNSGDDLDLVAPGGGADAPNSDSVYDVAHCDPDSLGKPIFQQTFIRGVRRFGLPRIYEGTSMAAPHVSAIVGARDRHEAARGQPEPARGRGAPRGHLPGDGQARPLRRRARGRGRGAALVGRGSRR